MNTKEQVELTKTISQETRRYSTLIMAIGYAGLFSIWNFTKEDLESWQVLSVGFLSIISLVIYIGFEFIRTNTYRTMAFKTIIQCRIRGFIGISK